MYTMTSLVYENITYMAVVNENGPRAIGMFAYAPNDGIQVYDIACVDDESGTKLVRHLASQPGFHPAPTLSVRWRIAMRYYGH